MKKLSILGSTGSVGINTLNVIRSNRDLYEIVALSAYRNVELLYKQITEFRPKFVAVGNEEIAQKLKELLASPSDVNIFYGIEGYKELSKLKEVDMVISAISGAAGLLPTLEALDAGKDIALANKEAIVMAGDIIMNKSRTKGCRILPLDSEHSAIFQCLLGHRHQDIRRIILTASGGPFLHLSPEKLMNASPAEAMKHPQWNMGKKISIDSASLMNKGLEVIEARWLFDISFDKIHIHVHPQSIVHSMVEYIDGAIIAQLGLPDMKIPISYALSFPERVPACGSSLDLLASDPLEFYAADFSKFPNLRLAYEAGKRGGTSTSVLNASNEVAVQAFVDNKLKFPHISKAIEYALSLHSVIDKPNIDDILSADNWARNITYEFIATIY